MKLDTQRHYNIITALRGPDAKPGDVFAAKLKWAFTARFRYWVDPTLEVCETRRTRQLIDISKNGLIDMTRRLESKPAWFNHFMSHAGMALENFMAVNDFAHIEPEEIAELDELLRSIAAQFRK